MMKKGLAILTSTLIMGLSLPLLSYAGEWKQDAIGWWYQNNDNSYPVNRWEWVDGNHDGIAECYYFNENGYCLMATTTPDNYTVNESGAWIVNGLIMTRPVESSTESANKSDVNTSTNTTQSSSQEKQYNRESNYIEDNTENGYSDQLKEWIKDADWSTYDNEMGDTASGKEWNWH